MSALLLEVASLHHVLVAGRYSEDIMMKAFWFGLIAIASYSLYSPYGSAKAVVSASLLLAL